MRNAFWNEDEYYDRLYDEQKEEQALHEAEALRDEFLKRGLEPKPARFLLKNLDTFDDIDVERICYCKDPDEGLKLIDESCSKAAVKDLFTGDITILKGAVPDDFFEKSYKTECIKVIPRVFNFANGPVKYFKSLEEAKLFINQHLTKKRESKLDELRVVAKKASAYHKVIDAVSEVLDKHYENDSTGDDQLEGAVEGFAVDYRFTDDIVNAWNDECEFTPEIWFEMIADINNQIHAANDDENEEYPSDYSDQFTDKYRTIGINELALKEKRHRDRLNGIDRELRNIHYEISSSLNSAEVFDYYPFNSKAENNESLFVPPTSDKLDDFIAENFSKDFCEENSVALYDNEGGIKYA